MLLMVALAGYLKKLIKLVSSQQGKAEDIRQKKEALVQIVMVKPGAVQT